MAQIAIIYDAAGEELAALVAEQVRSLGHEVSPRRRENFPTADPMVAFLASLPKGLIVISKSKAASEWLLPEVTANRSHYPQLGLVINSETAHRQPPRNQAVALSEDSLTPQALAALVAGLSSVSGRGHE